MIFATTPCEKYLRHANIIQSIQNRVYTIRGHRVMLDRDLAELYVTETRSLNLAVKRNMARFPEDFMFQLTTNEWEQLAPELLMRQKSNPLRSQVVISTPLTGAASEIPSVRFQRIMQSVTQFSLCKLNRVWQC
jgi:hypothetical protein